MKRFRIVPVAIILVSFKGNEKENLVREIRKFLNLINKNFINSWENIKLKKLT